MLSLYIELTELLRSEDASVERVDEVMSRDLAMTATILKPVNSAYFGLRRELTSPAEAAAYLGMDLLKELSLALNVFSQFDSAMVPGVSIQGLWHHSMSVAVAARQIALCEGWPIYATWAYWSDCPSGGNSWPPIHPPPNSEALEHQNPKPRTVTLTALNVGHRLAAGILTADGTLIVPAGTVVTAMHLEKIRNFAQVSGIQEPIQVEAAGDFCGSSTLIRIQ